MWRRHGGLSGLRGVVALGRSECARAFCGIRVRQWEVCCSRIAYLIYVFVGNISDWLIVVPLKPQDNSNRKKYANSINNSQFIWYIFITLLAKTTHLSWLLTRGCTLPVLWMCSPGCAAAYDNVQPGLSSCLHLLRVQPCTPYMW